MTTQACSTKMVRRFKVGDVIFNPTSSRKIKYKVYEITSDRYMVMDVVIGQSGKYLIFTSEYGWRITDESIIERVLEKYNYGR